MRSVLLTVALAACWSSTPTPPSVAPPASVAQFVPTDATSVSAWRPNEFPFLTLLDGATPDMFECWRALEQKIAVAYQVFTTARSSFAVLEGDLPRNQVEKCVDESLLYNNLLTHEVRRDGDLTVVETKLGTVYAAWRGRFVVLGNRDDVTQALAATASPAWTDEIAKLPRGFATHSFVAISIDRLMANMLGVPTIRWKLSLESAATPWPVRELLTEGTDALSRFGDEQAEIARRKEQGLPPLSPAAAPPSQPLRDPVFTGRLEVSYATAGEATRAGQVLAKAAFAFELEANLAAALARLPQTITGTTLVVRFDQTSLAGVDLEKLQGWMARAQAATSPR